MNNKRHTVVNNNDNKIKLRPLYESFPLSKIENAKNFKFSPKFVKLYNLNEFYFIMVKN